ncbi:hypothetical protein NUW58_g10089 [Xylaria curta]|uniref:Uncharacterized protein n=1 Tax=Xylaria curta TaxID=42375 RepID=A0ACC1MR63_9PEZI|nr:hypothetical protein NUW58_g10089 [Xylaria curta]
MADRFPSLDDFDSGAQTEIKDVGSPSADDFLARERALLGDDATQFTTGNESAALSGPSDDLLGGDEPAGNAQFESQFPDLGSNGGSTSAPGQHHWSLGKLQFWLRCLRGGGTGARSHQAVAREA